MNRLSEVFFDCKSLPANLLLWLSGHKFTLEVGSHSRTSLELLMEEAPDIFAHLPEPLPETPSVCYDLKGSEATEDLCKQLSSLLPWVEGSSEDSVDGVLRAAISYISSLKEEREKLEHSNQLTLLGLLFKFESDSELRSKIAQQLSATQDLIAAELLKLEVIGLDKLTEPFNFGPQDIQQIPDFLSEFSTFSETYLADTTKSSSLDSVLHSLNTHFNQHSGNIQTSLQLASTLLQTEIDTAGLHAKELGDEHLCTDANGLLDQYKTLTTGTASVKDIQNSVSLVVDLFSKLIDFNSKIMGIYLDTIEKMGENSELVQKLQSENQEYREKYESLQKSHSEIKTENTEKERHLELIQDLTRQNSELLFLLKQPRNAIEKVKIMHENTNALDEDIKKLNEELGESPEEAKSTTPSQGAQSPPLRTEPEKIMLENYQLKHKLIQSEAKCAMLSQGESYIESLLKARLKSQNLELQKLMRQKNSMAISLEKMKDQKSRLTRSLTMQKSLQERLRSLNIAYSSRDKIIDELRHALERQEGRTRLAYKESKQQKKFYLKTISEMNTHLQASGKETVKIPLFDDHIGKLESSLEQLKRQLEASSKENLSLREHIIQVNQVIAELEEANGELVREIQIKDEEIQFLQAASDDYAKQMNEIEEIMKEEENLIKESEQQLYEALDNNKKYQIQINGLNEELIQAKEELQIVQLENSRLIEQKSMLEEEYSLLIEERDDRTFLKKQNQNMLNDSEDILKDSNRDFEDGKARIQKLSQQCKEAAKRIEDLNEENNDLKEQIDQWENMSRNLEIEINKHKENSDSFETQCKAYVNEIENIASERDIVKQELEMILTKYNEITKYKERTELVLNDLTEKIATLESSNELFDRKINDLNDEIMQKNGIIRQFGDEKENLEKQIGSLNQEIVNSKKPKKSDSYRGQKKENFESEQSLRKDKSKKKKEEHGKKRSDKKKTEENSLDSIVEKESKGKNEESKKKNKNKKNTEDTDDRPKSRKKKNEDSEETSEKNIENSEKKSRKNRENSEEKTKKSKETSENKTKKNKETSEEKTSKKKENSEEKPKKGKESSEKTPKKTKEEPEDNSKKNKETSEGKTKKSSREKKDKSITEIEESPAKKSSSKKTKNKDLDVIEEEKEKPRSKKKAGDENVEKSKKKSK